MALSPDQIILTSSGFTTIKTLVHKDVYLYGYDGTKNRTSTNSFRVVQDSKKYLFRIVTDVGRYELSLDEYVAMSNGSFKMVKDLKVGEELFSTYATPKLVSLKTDSLESQSLDELVSRDFVDESYCLSVKSMEGERTSQKIVQPIHLAGRAETYSAKSHLEPKTFLIYPEDSLLKNESHGITVVSI